MYLHLGQNVAVSETEIIGVFDLDNTTGSRITRNFLNEAEKNGKVTGVSDELPKSFIVCSDKRGANTTRLSGRYDGTRIYLSQLSSQTLLKRSETLWF